MPPFGILANHKIKMCHNSMKKIMIQKIIQNNRNFWTVNLIMRAKNLLTSRQIFRHAVTARTVTKKHCTQCPIHTGARQTRHGQDCATTNYKLLRWLVETPSRTRPWALSRVHRFTVTRLTLQCHPGWRHVTFTKCKRKMYSTLFLFTFCLYFCFFGVLL